MLALAFRQVYFLHLQSNHYDDKTDPCKQNTKIYRKQHRVHFDIIMG